jgi:hypothetical protein
VKWSQMFPNVPNIGHADASTMTPSLQRIGPGDRCYDLKMIFSENIWRKNWRFWLETELNYAKIWSLHWLFKEAPILSPKIVENRRKLWS